MKSLISCESCSNGSSVFFSTASHLTLSSPSHVHCFTHTLYMNAAPSVRYFSNFSLGTHNKMKILLKDQLHLLEYVGPYICWGFYYSSELHSIVEHKTYWWRGTYFYSKWVKKNKMRQSVSKTCWSIDFPVGSEFTLAPGGP